MGLDGYKETERVHISTGTERERTLAEGSCGMIIEYRNYSRIRRNEHPAISNEEVER